MIGQYRVVSGWLRRQQCSHRRSFISPKQHPCHTHSDADGTASMPLDRFLGTLINIVGTEILGGMEWVAPCWR